MRYLTVVATRRVLKNSLLVQVSELYQSIGTRRVLVLYCTATAKKGTTNRLPTRMEVYTVGLDQDQRVKQARYSTTVQ